jgi:hypothetical protein
MNNHHNLRKLSALGDDDPAIPQWVWKGYIAPGTITVLCAGYKFGKSTLLTLLYDAMRNGGTLAGETVAKGIAHVASEEPDRVWKARKKKFDLEGHVEVDIRPFPVSPSLVRWEDYVASFLDTPAHLNVFDSTLHFLPTHAECDREQFQKAINALRRLTDAGRAVILTHQPAKGRNGDFNLRGYGIVDGEPETLVEIKPPLVSDSNDRQRIIQVRSRLPDYTPPRRLVELNPEGKALAVLPMPLVDGTFETGWPAMKFLLDDARERMTVLDIFAAWLPDFWKPSLVTLRRWLEQAVREKRLEKFGTGKKRSPFRYALPGKKFNPFGLNDADLPDIQAMDRERYG